MPLVPTHRLIHVATLVLVPAAAVAAFAPQFTVAAAAVVVVALLVAIIDGALAMASLDRVRVLLQDTIRATRGVPTEIPITLDGVGDGPRRLHIGIGLPESIHRDQDALLVSIPDDAARVFVPWKVTPMLRGHYPIDRVFLAAASPMGLWERRRAAAAKGSLRVYPNVQRERRNLAALFLDRAPFGVHARRATGKGREFEQLREYIHGDPLDDIHWKASARRGEPITKMFQVERTQEVYVVIDSSRTASAVLGEPELEGATTNLERYITSALVMGLAAELQGDLFGVVTFDSRVKRFIKAHGGRGHYNACRDAIYDAEPNAENPDFAELFSFIRIRLRKRALIVVLTNLSDPVLADEFARHVNLVSRNHLVLALSIKDPEVAPMFSTGPVPTASAAYAALGAHLEWDNLQRVRQALRMRNVSLTFAPHESLSAELVTQYLSQKERQLL